LVISAIGLILTGVWYGTRLSALTVSEVMVEGGETIDKTDVKNRVEKVLEGEYLGLVPRRFTWFYPKAEITTAIQAIDRIYDIKVDRTNDSTIHVSFDEYVPHALWCDDVNDNCLFLSKTGYAFAQAPDLSGGSFVRYVTTEEEAEVRESFASPETFVTLLRLVELLSDRGWFVSQVELDQVGDAFLSVVGGGELKVAINIVPEATVDNLFVALSSDEFIDIEPGNFQYIDLRFGNKVFINKESVESVKDSTLEDGLSTEG